MMADYEKGSGGITYTETLTLDLSTVVPSMSGPKRPHDRVDVATLRQDFTDGLTANVSFKGYGLAPMATTKKVPVTVGGKEYTLGHGSVAIAAITSCTNTSNPSVMLAAGLVARKAVELGLEVPAFVKTSLSPGSGVVTKYLETSGLLPYLETLGFNLAGYGCMTCIGNSGPLDEPVATAIDEVRPLP